MDGFIRFSAGPNSPARWCLTPQSRRFVPHVAAGDIIHILRVASCASRIPPSALCLGVGLPGPQNLASLPVLREGGGSLCRFVAPSVSAESLAHRQRPPPPPLLVSSPEEFNETSNHASPLGYSFTWLHCSMTEQLFSKAGTDYKRAPASVGWRPSRILVIRRRRALPAASSLPDSSLPPKFMCFCCWCC